MRKTGAKVSKNEVKREQKSEQERTVSTGVTAKIASATPPHAPANERWSIVTLPSSSFRRSNTKKYPAPVTTCNLSEQDLHDHNPPQIAWELTAGGLLGGRAQDQRERAPVERERPALLDGLDRAA